MGGGQGGRAERKLGRVGRQREVDRRGVLASGLPVGGCTQPGPPVLQNSNQQQCVCETCRACRPLTPPSRARCTSSASCSCTSSQPLSTLLDAGCSSFSRWASSWDSTCTQEAGRQADGRGRREGWTASPPPSAATAAAAAGAPARLPGTCAACAPRPHCAVQSRRAQQPSKWGIIKRSTPRPLASAGGGQPTNRSNQQVSVHSLH